MSLNEPRRLEAAPNFLSGFREKKPRPQADKKDKERHVSACLKMLNTPGETNDSVLALQRERERAQAQADEARGRENFRRMYRAFLPRFFLQAG